MEEPMRRLFPLVLLAALGCATRGGEVPVAAPEQVGLSSGKLHRIGPVIEEMIEKKKIAGEVLLIAKDGEIAYQKAWGRMDLEAGKPMRTDTIFRIYSMTKAIVTAAALVLFDEGKLGLDDPVGKWIPELKDLPVQAADGVRKPTRPPTVKDLMLHTAGFTYGGAGRPSDKLYGEKKPLEAKDLDDMAERLAAIPLAYDPGKDWIYSVSIDVLGLVIERVSGMKLDRWLEERIFKPLDLKDTGFSVPAEKLDRFAANYNRTPDGLKLGDAPGTSKYGRPATFFSGGGGLVSTARDYMRFLLMVEGAGELQGVRILKPGTVRLMTTDQLPREAFPIYFGKQVRHGTGFGLGFSVRTKDTEWDPSGREGEYGWGGAASTHYWVSPKDRLVVVTLEQTMPYSFDTEFAVKGLIYDAIVRP
jgi:CubicO group peptidase (beta-lactamase class C family)